MAKKKLPKALQANADKLKRGESLSGNKDTSKRENKKIVKQTNRSK